MRSRTAQWFETKVRYDKTMEDGMPKKVIESYVVDALSFGEAEERITKEMSVYISGEFNVKQLLLPPTAKCSFLKMPMMTVGIRPSYSLLLSTRKLRRKRRQMSITWYRQQT